MVWHFKRRLWGWHGHRSRRLRWRWHARGIRRRIRCRARWRAASGNCRICRCGCVADTRGAHVRRGGCVDRRTTSLVNVNTEMDHKLSQPPAACLRSMMTIVTSADGDTDCDCYEDDNEYRHADTDNYSGTVGRRTIRGVVCHRSGRSVGNGRNSFVHRLNSCACMQIFINGTL